MDHNKEKKSTGNVVNMGSSKPLISSQTTRALRVSMPARYDMHNKQLVHIALN